MVEKSRETWKFLLIVVTSRLLRPLSDDLGLFVIAFDSSLIVVIARDSFEALRDSFELSEIVGTCQWRL